MGSARPAAAPGSLAKSSPSIISGFSHVILGWEKRKPLKRPLQWWVTQNPTSKGTSASLSPFPAASKPVANLVLPGVPPNGIQGKPWKLQLPHHTGCLTSCHLWLTRMTHLEECKVSADATWDASEWPGTRKLRHQRVPSTYSIVLISIWWLTTDKIRQSEWQTLSRQAAFPVLSLQYKCWQQMSKWTGPVSTCQL